MQRGGYTDHWGAGGGGGYGDPGRSGGGGMERATGPYGIGIAAEHEPMMMMQQQQMNMMQVSCYSALQATPTEHARAACGTGTLDLYDGFNFKPECFVKLFELH